MKKNQSEIHAYMHNQNKKLHTEWCFRNSLMLAWKASCWTRVHFPWVFLLLCHPAIVTLCLKQTFLRPSIVEISIMSTLLFTVQCTWHESAVLHAQIKSVTNTLKIGKGVRLYKSVTCIIVIKNKCEDWQQHQDHDSAIKKMFVFFVCLCCHTPSWREKLFFYKLLLKQVEPNRFIGPIIARHWLINISQCITDVTFLLRGVSIALSTVI